MLVGIVAQRENEDAAALASDVSDALEAVNGDVEVWLDEATAGALDASGMPTAAFDACDLVVSIGGDGTFLYAAHGAGSVPVLGVNLGEVGFLNAVAPGDAVGAVRREVRRFREDGAVRSTPVPRVVASGDGWTLSPALNEVVVHGAQRGHGQGVTVDVTVDGDRYAATHADGVLVATPTGSTAYNLSEDGPLVRPGADALVVTLMSPRDSMPPLVVDADATVTVAVSDAAAGEVISDAKEREPVQPPAEVTVTRAAEPARVAGPGVDFFGALGKLDRSGNGTD
jgi:NAD+ kinase